MQTATTHVRRTVRPEDPAAIGELHRRVYGPEYGLNDTFVDAVRAGAERAVAAGWPATGGGAWLVEVGGVVRGSLGLTDAGDGLGHVRWFALEPELRGLGLGRRLLDELLELARASGLRRLELGTFSALTTAGRMYREAGFRVTSEHERTDWGAPVTFQYYALDL
jgi:ribosomal protein S18 acetylase RimI-like enzyme